MRCKILFAIMMMFLCMPVRAQELSSFVDSDLLATLHEGEKAALLMVHFGTTYDETRTKTIDAINAKARAAFPQIEVRESYTSRIILRRLAKKGIRKETPLQAMLRLRADGYTHLVVQSTHLIDGTEMESLRKDVERVRHLFTEVRVGVPLLYHVDDAMRVADILTQRHPADARKHEHVLFEGHVTHTPATALYSEMDYMLKASGHDNYHVGTIEGYPTFDTALRLLKKAKAKRVTLVPFLFVAGDHAANDISVEWKEKLESEGLKTDLHIEGLGEVPQIQDIFIEHVRTMMMHRVRPVTEIKDIYSKQKD